MPPRQTRAALALTTALLGCLGWPAAFAQDAWSDLRQRLTETRAQAVLTPPAAAPRTEPGVRASDVAAKVRATLRRPLPAPGGPADDTGERQRAALTELLSASSEAEVHLRPENHTVRQLRGLSPEALPPRARPAAVVPRQDPARLAALGFLTRQRDLFRLREPEQELVLERHETDALGQQHLHFAQRHGGLPVWPAVLSVHLDAANRVRVCDGAYIPTPAGLELTPTVTREEAVRRAQARFPGGTRGTATRPELIIHAPLDAAPALAWRLNLSIGPVQAWRCVVDARSGRLVAHESLVQTENVAGSGTDLRGVSRTLSVWRNGANHYLLDTGKPMFKAGSDPLQNPQGVISVLDAADVAEEQFDPNKLFYVTSASPAAWPIPASVSAASNFSRTYDYFFQRHGRNSIDGQGGNITATVRIQMDNAWWRSDLSMMGFGTVRPFAEALDVIAHEMTHGITSSTANLVYRNQPGAMNEAFSDIFGELVEAAVRGGNDWLLGSDLGAGDRNLKDPGALIIPGLGKPYPAKFSDYLDLTAEQDHGGVHLNSSIINHAFYQLAAGLPGAVGLADAERIFYRALTQHLQPQSQFVDCRLAALAAAEALFGRASEQTRKVGEAFDRVEIYAAPTTPTPAPVPVVQGADSTLFIYESGLLFTTYNLGRRETARGDGLSGSIFAEDVKLARPAITGDGQLALTVTADSNLQVTPTAAPTESELIDVASQVHSIALSPDGDRMAFVLRDPVSGEPEGKITVASLRADESRTFNLVSPALDGTALDQILHADSLAFATDGRSLVYDAVSRVRFGSGPSVLRWSIYALELDSGATSVLVPPLEGIDTGNPTLGRVSNRLLAFDAQAADGRSGVFVADMFTGEVELAGVVENGVGYPSFTGDEGSLIYARPTALGSDLVQQRLARGPLAPSGEPSAWLEDARLGVIYRRGAFVGTNALPVVTLDAPMTATPAAIVPLVAQASDSDGSIARVEFYANAVKLGEATTATSGSYRLDWTVPAAGTYRLVARGFDNLGAARDSAIVSMVVPPSGDPLSLSVEQKDTGLQLKLTGSPGTYGLERSADLVNWMPHATLTLDASGAATHLVTSGTLGTGPAFFRARRR